MRQYYLGFALFPGIGTKRFHTLVQAFGSPRAAWEADGKNLEKILGKALAEKFVDFRKTFSFERISVEFSQKGVRYIISEDNVYPQLLRELPSHPFVLFIKGETEVLNSAKTIGIVGTRKITQYGRQVTERLTRELVAQGFVTVSGLALGVDATVHNETLQSGGKTIAVLGCGVDYCYPRENQQIYDEIIKRGGAVVSTFPPGLQPSKGSFPARNAIIAGLSLGVVVTEGAADSGALITASFAKEFGRPVCAVPGPITSELSEGANILLRQGAHVTAGAEDILDALHLGRIRQTDRKDGLNVSAEERKILDVIQLCPLHFDQIVRTIGKSPQEIGSILSRMELKGLVENNQGVYIKIV